MMIDSYRTILASASPRRKELLGRIIPVFERIAANVDESIAEGMEPYVAVAMLSQKKAEEVSEGAPESRRTGTGTIIIGADTVVAMGDQIFGKPRDEHHAFKMLSQLQGNAHQVYTGVTIIIKTPIDHFKKTFTECTTIEVASIGEGQIRDYIATGEPIDKAGAYAIQGAFCKYVTRISGDYNNVVGLPVARLYSELQSLFGKII